MAALSGEHQKANAALALRICRAWIARYSTEPNFLKLNLHLVRIALQNTNWPGRQQKFTKGQNSWYLDGAHTIESIQFAVDWFVRKSSAHAKKILLFHCSHDRSYQQLLAALLQISSSCFQEAFFARPYSPTDLVKESEDLYLSLHQSMKEFFKVSTGISARACTVKDAVTILEAIDSPTEILVTGSLYIVGDVMRILDIPIP